MKLQYKKRQLSANQSILCSRYELQFSINNSQHWIINFIIPNDFIIIPEFLEDFAREFIITDEVYRAAGLHHKCHFQNKIEQDDLDEEVRVELRAIFKRRMESNNIIILEDDDLLISKYGVNMKTEFHVDISQFRFKPSVHISMSLI